MGGSEHSQQRQQSETAIAVDKEFTNERKDMETKEDQGASASSKINRFRNSYSIRQK
jgi:hypothetical protein